MISNRNIIRLRTLSDYYKRSRNSTELSLYLFRTQLKVIGLPFEVGDNLRGQPDHLEMECTCCCVAKVTRRVKVIGLLSELHHSADNLIT